MSKHSNPISHKPTYLIICRRIIQRFDNVAVESGESGKFAGKLDPFPEQGDVEIIAKEDRKDYSILE